MNEVQRISEEYRRRARDIPAGAYSLTEPVNLFFTQQRARHALALLRRLRVFPLRDKHILEIGCGGGGWLPDLESWGARRGNLAGIDLDDARVATARRRLSGLRDAQGNLLAPGADIRLGDASDLPWPDASFDLVLQSTVFTSILDEGMKRAVAGEMLRVLKPRGIILWYDFFYNNPRNPHVRGVGKREIQSLFPNCLVSLRRITLAPPIAKRIVSFTWLGALVLEKLYLLNTHYLGSIRNGLTCK
jgi:ubiquinone/menaquinone biosynthesis C-methylase UbiE